MGMMLRRRRNNQEVAPTVNGKPVKQEPKKRSLTNNEKATATTVAPKRII